MNLKDRGILLGDLIILLVFIVSITFVFKTINKNKQTSLNIINSELSLVKRI